MTLVLAVEMLPAVHFVFMVCGVFIFRLPVCICAVLFNSVTNNRFLFQGAIRGIGLVYCSLYFAFGSS